MNKKLKAEIDNLDSGDLLELFDYTAKVLAAKRADLDIKPDWESRLTMAMALLGKYKLVGDKGVSQTKRVAVEYKKYQTETGLLDESIPWWVFVLGGAEYKNEIAIIVKTRRLMRLAVDALKVNGGDNKAARLALVPIASFLKTNSELAAREISIFNETPADYILREYFRRL